MSTSPAPNRRKLTLWRVIAIFGALVFLGMVTFVVLLAVGLSGGLKGVVASMQSPPTAKELAAPKASWSKALTRNLDAAMDPGAPFQFAQEARDDVCNEGQNNWKIQDGYAHKCELKITRFYAFSDDLRASLIVLDLRLQSEGFTLLGSETMAETTNAIGFGTPSTDLLYPPCYQKGDLSLCMRLADRNTREFSSLTTSQRLGYGPPGPGSELVDAASVAKEILQTQQYVLALSVKGTYYEK